MKDLIKHPEFLIPEDVEPEVKDAKADVYDPLKISHEQRVYESLPEGARAKVDRYGFNSEPAQDLMGMHEHMMVQAERFLAREMQIEKRDVTKDRRERKILKNNDKKKAASDIQIPKIRKRRDEFVAEGLKPGDIIVELMEEFDLKKSRISAIIKE